ncbi:RNA deprotection pyrophosphohydrolase [Rossellomorea vietnamensis]|uniref:7,8-dihydro-8-oxoguanine-triphosphatase n=1 Tax=Rossellomorea vietnamensis TaxID=218284 RepID=A0A0P6W1L8_9BACI|nr:nucleoside triphosphatase YtkD [Rossellomorea vietnamensis]KPL59097.1 7,8-dihydro-8-oxoguanine-triphosphatase [Rossellomorea vietnamensis]
MEQFTDENGIKVELSFHKGKFQQESYHVLVICRYKGQWLLTRHKKRGLEFPGGKREQGETLEEAATRETFEETGGVIKEPVFIGEYKVFDRTPFVKTIFFAEADELIRKDDYLETEGAVLWNGDFSHIQKDPSFSFIMKDQVVESALIRVRDLDLMT